MAEGRTMDPEERILVLAPLGRDAALACEVLAHAGLRCVTVADAERLCREIETGAAAVLITAEALAEPAARDHLLSVLETQPAWSDLPLTLLVRGEGQAAQNVASLQKLSPSHNVTILERPVPVSTLTSVVQAAVRARRRQYEVRDHLRWQARQSAELEAIIESIPDGVLVGTMEEISLANDSALRILGYESLAALNADLREWPILQERLNFRDVDSGAVVRAEDVGSLTVEGSTEYAGVFSMQRANDGAQRILRVISAPVRQRAGEPWLVTIINDITEARRAEEALRQSEARFRTSVESMLDSFGIYSAVRDTSGEVVDFRIEYVNEAACQSSGMAREEQVGRRMLRILPAHPSSRLFDDFCAVVETGEPLTQEALVYEEAGGRERALDFRAAKLGDGLVATWRDVTDRRETEAALEEARVELEARVEARTAELTYTNAILEEQIEVRERAETQLRRRNKELSTLNMITAAASSSLELANVLTTLRDMLHEELGIAGGIVFFYEEERDELTLHYSWGLPQTVHGWDKPFAVRHTHFETIIHRKNSVYRPEVQELSLYATWELHKSRPDWHSYLCVPLLARGQVEGAFSLFSERPAFNREQRAFYITLGQQIGVAISNARLYEEVLNRGERLQQLAQRIISVQEEERHRVSRELHDEAGQALTALMLSLEMTKSTLPGEMEVVRESIEEAVELTGDTMEQIRLLAHDLRTPSLDTIGLSPTLQGLCSDFGGRSQLEIEYQGTELPRLSDMAAISLYRVAQEALTNVARHARATHVEMRLRHEDDTVTLEVVDDGSGFDPQSVLYEAPEGIGLPGLKERMETLGGHLEILSAPGKGTRVIARVPLTDSVSASALKGEGGAQTAPPLFSSKGKKV